MQKTNLKRVAGAALALLFSAMLAGCGEDTTPKASAGIEAVLDKAMPASIGAIIVLDDAYLLFHKPPSSLEQTWDFFIWTGNDRNAREGSTTGVDDWYLSAHREGAHWVVDDTTIDPAQTSPADMVSVLHRCIAASEADDRAQAEADRQAAAGAKAQSARSYASITAWHAAASGVVLVSPASSSGN